jgi:hypothetical protein
MAFSGLISAFKPEAKVNSPVTRILKSAQRHVDDAWEADAACTARPVQSKWVWTTISG